MIDKRTIYKLTNTVSGMMYVGQTKQSIQKRRRCHIDKARTKNGWKSTLHEDIIKYGQDKFVIESIEICDVRDVNDKEREWISKLNTIEPNGYNREIGGKRDSTTDYTKKRMSDHIKSAEHKNNISKSKKGQAITESQRKGLNVGRNLPKQLAGEKNPNSILSEREVKEIRNLWANRKTKKITQNELADLYGVTQMTISAIVTRKIWKHVA